MDLASSALILAIIAITSIIFIAGFSALFLITNSFWNLFLESNHGRRVVEYLERQDGKYLEIGYLFFVPSLLGLAILAYTATYIDSYSDNGIFYQCILSAVAPAIFGIFLYNFLSCYGRLPKASLTENLQFGGVLALGTLSYLTTPILVFIFYFSVFTSEYSRPESLGDLINGIFFVSAICLLFSSALLANKASANSDNPNPLNSVLQYAGTGLFILFFVITFTNSWFTIPQAVLNIYGLVDVDGVEIAVDKEHCKTLDALGVRYIINERNEVCILRNSKIESKIGVNFLIKTEDGKRIHLPKNVITLSELPPSGITIIQHDDGKYEITNGNKHIKNLRIYVVYVNDKTNKVFKEELIFSRDYLEMKKTIDIGEIEFLKESGLRRYFEIRIRNKKRGYFQKYSHLEN